MPPIPGFKIGEYNRDPEIPKFGILGLQSLNGTVFYLMVLAGETCR